MQQGQGNPIQRPERLRGRLEFPDTAYFELRGREDYPELLADGKRTTEALYAKLGRSLPPGEEQAEAEAAALLCIALTVSGCFQEWEISRFLQKPS
jgi:hypothetical protein